MMEASSKLEFEKAAMYRDDIQSLEILKEKQIISNTNISENQDIIGLARGIDEVLIQVFLLERENNRTRALFYERLF